MKASGATKIHKLACRIWPKRTLTALGTAMGLLFLSLGMDSYAQTNVTPAQYLQLQQKPNFAANSRLPPLTGGSVEYSYDLRKEMGTNWGYAISPATYYANPDGGGAAFKHS